MNPRRQAFVDAYVSSGNAKQSAITAGYSDSTPHVPEVQGSRLLRSAEVSEAIASKAYDRATSADLDAEWVLTRLMDVAALAETTGNLPAATAALRELGRHLQLFTDKLDVRLVADQAAELAKEHGIDPAELEALTLKLLEPPKGA